MPSVSASPSAESFELFVRNYSQALAKIAYSLSDSPADAQDLLQTVLLKVFRSWNRISPEARYSYTRRALVNQSISIHRTAKVLENRTEALPDKDGGGIDLLNEVEVRDALGKALALLPFQYRATIILRYVEGLSISETAELLSMSENSVKSCCFRGLGMLRKSEHLQVQVIEAHDEK